MVGTDAAPRPNNTFTRVALRGKRVTQSAYDALCKAHTARAVARQRVKGKGVGKGKGRGKGKGVGKVKGRGKRKDTEADKGEDTGKGKGKARGKAKLLQRASRKKYFVRAPRSTCDNNAENGDRQTMGRSLHHGRVEQIRGGLYRAGFKVLRQGSDRGVGHDLQR